MSETSNICEVNEGAHGYELRFVRWYPQPIEKVWAALTQPDRLADWLAAAEVEPRRGGAFRLHWQVQDHRMTGVIVVCEPPTHLAWTWPDPQHPNSVVSWRLAPENSGTRVTFTQDALPASVLPDVATGWHTHLEGLPEAAAGRSAPWRADREREIATLYVGRLPIEESGEVNRSA